MNIYYSLALQEFEITIVSLKYHQHSLAVFRNFLKNVKTLEPKTYITILNTP